ncbi:MAG: hypothetical protein HQK76_00125 [Desulfobacterales bacterium]|nr:hypothetical protein [Desulfobacterales bacterium]
MKRILVYITALILLIIGLSIYGVSLYKKTSNIDIYPEIVNIKPFEATVAWQSNNLYKGRIYYHPVKDDTNPLLSEESIAGSYQHEIILTGLNPSTRYTYWIDKSNMYFQFQTQPSATTPFSFILLSGNVLGFDIKELIVSELPEFIFYTNSISDKNLDSFNEIRSFLPIFNMNGADANFFKAVEDNIIKPLWLIQWGGLDIIILNKTLTDFNEIKAFLNQSSAHTIGIMTNFESMPPDIHAILVEHNLKKASNVVVFVLILSSYSETSDKDGIKYAFISSDIKSAEAIRVDVDTEWIKATFINEGKEVFLKSPPLKQKRTCEECRRLADKGAYEESIRAYKDFIENHKGHFQIEDAYYAIASIYDEKLFQFKQALSWYKRLIEEYPEGTLSSLAKQRVDYLMEYNEYNFEPLSRFERIKKVEFGRQIQNIKAQENLLKQVETIIETYPNCKLAPVMLYWLANQYRQISLEKAVNSYLKLRQNYPDYQNSKEVMIDIGDAYYQAGKYQKSLLTYQKALIELSELNQTITNQIKRCNRNILRDRLFYVALSIFIFFTLMGLFLKPFQIDRKRLKLITILALVVMVVLYIYGFLIREQFSSNKEMYLLIFGISIMVWFSSWISLCCSNNLSIWNKMSSKSSRLFSRIICSILVGFCYFISGLYIIIYSVNIHYLLSFQL